MEILQPGQNIRPHLSHQMAITLVQRLYGLKGVTIIELNGYDDKNYHVQICEGIKSKRHVVRMLTYQPGKLLNQVPCTHYLLFKLGKFIGQMDQVLKGFHHPAYDTDKSIWALESVPLLRKFTFAVKDVDKNTLVNNIIDVFDREVVSIMDNMEKGIIHGDLNEQNVLVEPDPADGSWSIAAVLDFGDAHHSCYLFELAVSICYMILLSEDTNPLDAGGHVIAGYSTLRPLPDIEFSILKICVSARLCQSLVMGAYSYLQDPGNKYLLTTAQKGWNILELLWNTPQNDLVNRWRRIVASYHEQVTEFH